MTKNISIDHEVALFLASLDPAKVLTFKPSPAIQERVDFLFDKEKTAGLTYSERDELDHFLVINRLVVLAKNYAFQLLKT